MRNLFCVFISLIFYVCLNAQTVSGNKSLCGGTSALLTVSGVTVNDVFVWQYSATGNDPWNDLANSNNRINYSVTTLGFYRVKVTSNSNKTSNSFEVKASTPPAVSFTNNNNGTCSGTSVTFTPTVSGGVSPYTYQWTFADGQTSAAATVNHAFTYTGCGTRQISNQLTVTDDNGCSTSVNVQMPVLEKPEVQLVDIDGANFRNCDNSPTLSNPSYTINVDNSPQSSSCINSYSIDWGDNSQQSNITFPLSHTYTQLGAYNMVVSVVGTNGCKNSRTYVVANQSNPAGGLATLGMTTNLCAPADIPFLISTWEDNSPGTTYQMDFGDGTVLTLTQPLKPVPGTDTVHHVYNTSSCTFGYGTYTAYLTAINACSSTPYSAGNIQINTKSVAKFTAPLTACVNQSICFNNQTDIGYTGSGCQTNTKYSWDFGDNSSISNTSSPCHIYTTPGTYTVTLVDSNRCGLSTATQTVCVLPVPVPSFSLDKTNGCGPLSVSTTNTSNTLIACAVSQYNWNITYSAGGCGTASDFAFTNGTDASSVSPSFLFKSAGTYTIELAVTNTCGTFKKSQTVTVTEPPVATLSNISNACGTSTISPVAKVSGCSSNNTYSWSFPGGSPASSTAAIPGTITYSTPGSYTVTLQVTGDCGTATASQTFSVGTLPVVTVPASSSYCSGTTTSAFTFSSNPPATLTWTNDNTSTGIKASSGTGNIAPFTAQNNTASTQVSHINVSATVNGCTGSNTFNITVYPEPHAPAANGAISYCVGQTPAPLSATADVGSTLLWYTVATGGSGSVTPPTPSTTAAGTTIYYVSQVSNNGNCEGQRTAITVTVNDIPVFTATSQDPSQCGVANGSIVLNGLTSNKTYLITYTQGGVAKSATLTSDGNGTVTLGGLAAGLYDHLTASAAGCPSAEAGPFTLSSPTPPATPTLSSNAPICSNNTLQLDANTTSAGTATWSWTGPNGYSSTLKNPAIPNVPVSASGTYYATVTINNCVSAPGSLSVIINPTPAVPAISSNTPVCSGNDVLFTNPSGEAGATYSWSGPNGFTSTDKSPFITGATTTATGAYIVTVTLGTCTSQGNTNVVVNETPSITGVSFKDPTQCASSTGNITLTGVLSSKTFTVSYTKNGALVSVQLSSDTGGNILIAGLTAGVYDAFTVSINGCISNAKGPITLTDPNPPTAPTTGSNAPLCTGSVLNLTATSNEAGTYTWSGPAGFTSNSATPVVNGVTATNAGTYNVTITVNNCTSPAGSVNVIVNPLAAAPAAASPIEYCINTLASALTATSTNGSALNWYNTASGGAPLPQAPTPTTTTTGSVFYYVSQTSTSGCEGARSTVEVITHPDAKALFQPQQALGCSPFVINSGVVNLQPFPNNNSDYKWYANGVNIGAGAAFPGYTIQKDNDSVTIKLLAISKFGCRNDSMEQKFSTYQLPKTAFTSNSTGGCGPITVSFVNQTLQASLFKFKWIFGNGQTSEDENPQPVTFATNPTYGDTTYQVTLLGYTVCDTITATMDILVKSKPKSLFAPDKTNGCSPLPVRFDNISKGFGTGYQWFFGDGATTTTTDASPVTHTYSTGIQDTFYAKMVATNSCGTDTSVFAIVVSPSKVKLNVALNGNQAAGCVPHAVQFINRSSGATTFAWNFGDGNTLNTTKNIDTVSHTYAKSGTYTLTLFASNGCSDTTTTETITVFDKPAAGFTAAPSSVCIGDTVFFQNTATGFSSIAWTFGDNSSSVLGDPQHAYANAGSYTVTQIAQQQYNNGTVCADTATKTVTVVSQLPGAFTASAASGSCVPFVVTFTNNTLPSVLTTWTFGDGTTATGDVVTHTFTIPGSYTVAMQAKHPAGCLYTASKTITVNAPSGTIAYAPGFVCNNTPVRFESNTTNTDSVRWNFGDGTSTTTKDRVIYHVFAKPGVFVPKAELVSINGCIVPVATNDTIKVDYLQAGFAQQQDAICGKTTVHFNDTSQAFFGIRGWQWNLGDGTQTSQQSPVHDYTTSGTLPIQLVTTSNSGCSDTAKLFLPVKVNDKPVAAISGPSAACDVVPVAYTSSVTSIDNISLYQWTITGNASYNTPNITHTFPSAGSYRVQFVAGTAYGCYDTVVQNVTVSTTPNVTAGSDVTICRGAATSLTAGGSAASYNWQANASLSCTACTSPMAAPDSTTQYRVTGTATNGCTRTDSVLVTVIQPFVLTVPKGDSICIGQSKQLSVSGAYMYVWTPANTLDDSTSQHPIATPAASTTYSVTGTDAYHCFTDTKTVVVGVGEYPTVSLGRDTMLSTGTVFPLHSIITEGPVKTYTWTPADNLSCSSCAVPDVNVKRNTCYTLAATNYYGCAGRDTVCIKVFCESSQVFIANLFTPDGDGINDKLVVQGKGIALIRSFRIFNRWGQVVFEKTGFLPNDASSGWDGRINGGAMASEDVYVYTCDVVCDDGTVYPLKGNVAIVK